MCFSNIVEGVKGLFSADNIGSTMSSVGTGLQIAGSISAGQAARSSAEAQARIYENEAFAAEQEAKIAEQQAADALRRGSAEERRARLRAKIVKSSQRAQSGGAGFIADSGSPLSLLIETDMVLADDAEVIRHNAQLEKWGYDVRAVNAWNASANSKYMASSAREQGAYAYKSGLIGGLTGLTTAFGGAWSKPATTTKKKIYSSSNNQGGGGWN
jgi:hypothetical protein